MSGLLVATCFAGHVNRSPEIKGRCYQCLEMIPQDAWKTETGLPATQVLTEKACPSCGKTFTGGHWMRRCYDCWKRKAGVE